MTKKLIDLISAPGDYQPISCPDCSPSKRKIKGWRRTIQTEIKIDRDNQGEVTKNSRLIIEAWIKQLVIREIGEAWDRVHKEGDEFELHISPATATLIQEALEERGKSSLPD